MKNLMFLLTFTMVGFMLTVNTIAKTIVTDGLVSYWTFDQGTILGKKVKDVWNKNHATIVGNPREVDGYVRGGLKLDGDGDYVSLPNVGNFGSKFNDYTFEAWFKTTNKKNWSAIYRVLEKGCARGNGGTGILLNVSWDWEDHDLLVTEQDLILFEHSNLTDENGCGGGFSSTRGAPVSDGKWHQIVYTIQPLTEEDRQRNNRLQNRDEGCISMDVYIDTEQIDDLAGCPFIRDFVAYEEPIFLGAENNRGKASAFFEGVFDEVRIYDRALTHEEVIRNYESGIGLGVEAVKKLPTVWGALKEG